MAQISPQQNISQKINSRGEMLKCIWNVGPKVKLDVNLQLFGKFLEEELILGEIFLKIKHKKPRK